MCSPGLYIPINVSVFENKKKNRELACLFKYSSVHYRHALMLITSKHKLAFRESLHELQGGRTSKHVVASSLLMKQTRDLCTLGIYTSNLRFNVNAQVTFSPNL